MKRVFLLIDCDSCRQLYPHSLFASEDTSAWEVHGNNLLEMAERDGWAGSSCRNYQYCPTCLQENDELAPPVF